MSGSIHPMNGSASEQSTLAVRLQSYLLEKDLTHVKFGELCGVSNASVARALKNEALREETVRKIEAGLSGQAVSADEGAKLDETSEKLIEMIVSQSRDTGRFDGVVKHTFSKIRDHCGDDVAEKVAVDMLRSYLLRHAADADGRLKYLLELRDIVKERPRA